MTRPSRFLHRVFSRVGRWFVRPYHMLVVDEGLPDRLEHRTVYVVREDEFDEQAAMLCPCGCGCVLHMNLLSDERPFWRVTQNNDRTMTLYPSIRRKRYCRSHFWLRNGRIHWC